MKSYGISEFKKGYLVRLGFRDGVPTVQKSFQFGPRRSQMKTFIEALNFRDKELKRLLKTGELLTRNKRNLKGPQRNNTSGVLGIHFGQYKSNKGVWCDAFFWQTSWKDKDDGKLKSKGFSINKLGNVEAFKRCCQLRADKTGRKFETMFNAENLKIITK